MEKDTAISEVNWHSTAWKWQIWRDLNDKRGVGPEDVLLKVWKCRVSEDERGKSFKD